MALRLFPHALCVRGVRACWILFRVVSNHIFTVYLCTCCSFAKQWQDKSKLFIFSFSLIKVEFESKSQYWDSILMMRINVSSTSEMSIQFTLKTAEFPKWIKVNAKCFSLLIHFPILKLFLNRWHLKMPLISVPLESGVSFKDYLKVTQTLFYTTVRICVYCFNKLKQFSQPAYVLCSLHLSLQQHNKATKYVCNIQSRCTSFK